MQIIDKIRQLPQKQRQQVMYGILGIVLLILLLLWLLSSRLPAQTSSADNFFQQFKSGPQTIQSRSIR